MEEIRNESHTPITEFVLLGISPQDDLQVFLFMVFLIIYLFILTGNMMVFVATVSNHALHTPMYYFLRHLSILDICYTSVTLPQMLVNLMSERKTITFLGCATQMFFYVLLGAAVCYLLAIMACDRYLAICHPLHYVRLMTKKVCLFSVSGCWVTGFSISFVKTWLTFSLPFCGSDIINHFFCDISPLVRLHCPSTYVNNVERIITVFLILIAPFLLILVSYILIIAAILKITVECGKQKALGTCSSHLVSVAFFYGSAIFTHLRFSLGYSDPIEKLVSLTYTVAPAMLNPIIYSLRNKQVKDALRDMLVKSRNFVGT